MTNGYVEGYTTEVSICPFCGKTIYSYKADGSCICDECRKTFYVIENDME